MKSGQTTVEDYVIQALANQNMLATEISFPQDHERSLKAEDYSYFFQELSKNLKLRENRLETLELTRASDALESLAQFCQSEQPFFKKLKLELRAPLDPHLIDKLIAVLQTLDPQLSALQIVNRGAQPLAQEKLEVLLAFIQEKKLRTEIDLPPENAMAQQLVDELCSLHQREQRIASFGETGHVTSHLRKEAETSQASHKRKRRKLKSQNVGIDIEVQLELPGEIKDKEKTVEMDADREALLLDREEFVRRLKAREFDLPEEFYQSYVGREQNIWDIWMGNIAQLAVGPSDPSPDYQPLSYQWPVAGPAKVSRHFYNKDGREYNKDIIKTQAYNETKEDKDHPWLTQEVKLILPPDDQNTLHMTIEYNDQTVFERVEVDAFEGWKKEYHYDATQLDEKESLEEKIKADCPKKFHRAKVTEKLYENPRCRLMTAEAALHLLKHQNQLQFGLDFQHNIAGISLVEKEIEGVNRTYLDFNPKKALAFQEDYLALSLETAPKLASLSHPLFKQWLDQAHKKPSHKLLAERYRQLIYQGYERKQVELFKLYLPVLVEMSEEEIRAIGPGMNALVRAAKTYQTALADKPADFAAHLLLQLMKDATLNQRLRQWNERLGFSTADLNGILSVYDAGGEKAVAALLDFFEKAEQPVLKLLQQRLFPVLGSYLPLLEEQTADAINIINRFSESEFQWFSSLLGQHCAVVGADNLYNLTKAFQCFVAAIKEKKLACYPGCQFENIKSLPLTLSRILTILNHTKACDLPAVWAQITANNFQSNAAIRVVTDESASLGAGHLVLPILDIRPETYHPRHDLCFKGAPLPKHGYHGIEVQDLDPFRVLKKSEAYREKLPEETQSFQQLLAQGSNKQEQQKIFYRYVADQEFRYSLSFYQRAVELIETIFADVGSINKYNNFDLRSAAYAIIAVGTTGLDVFPHLDDEKSGLEQIKNILESLRDLPFPKFLVMIGWAPFFLELLVRYGFLVELRPMPPLSYMNHMLTILKVGFQENGSLFPDREKLEANGKKYLKSFKQISNLVQAYQYAYYEGIRFFNVTNARETEIFTYSEFATGSIHPLNDDLADQSPEAFNVIKSSLVALMSAFRLNQDCLNALHLDGSAASAKRRPALICALSLLRKMTTNISPLTHLELRPEDFIHFINELENRVNALPSDNNLELEKIATSLVRERFEAYFPVGFFDKIEVGELSEDISKHIRKSYLTVDEQAAVEKILKGYPTMVDQLNYGAALSALTRVYTQLATVDKPHFLALAASLNQGYGSSISSFIEFLSAVGDRGKIDDFFYLMSHSEVKAIRPLLPRLQRFFSSVLPYVEQNHHEKLSIRDLFPLSVSLTMHADESEAEFQTHYQGMMASLFSTVKAYPNEHQVILQLLTNYVKSIAIDLLPAQRGPAALAFMTIFHNVFVEQENADLVRSLCDHYQNKPADLFNILNLLNTEFTKDERGVLLFMLSALLNNGREFEAAALADFIRLCRENKPLIALIQEFYRCPPYPNIDKISAWHLAHAGSENYQAAMQADYLAFNARPCPREMENGFKIDEARRLAPLFKGIKFTEEDFQALARETEAVKGLVSASLREEVLNFKQLSKEEQRRNNPRLLACLADLLHRSKGFEGPLGSSFELSTVQYLAIYAFLKNGDARHITDEIATGEGKSRIMMICNGAAFAKGRTADFITSDMQLAQRDFLEYQSFFKILKAETALIYSSTPTSAYKMKGINFSDASNKSLFRNRARANGEAHLVLDPEPSARALLLDEEDRTEFDVSETRYNYSEEANDNIKNMDWIYDMLVRFFSHEDQVRYSKIYDLYHEDVDSCNEEFIKFLKAQHDFKPEMLQRVLALPSSQLESWQEAAFTALELKLGSDYALEPNVLVATARGTKMASEARLIYGFRNSQNSKFSFGVHQCLHAHLNRELKNNNSQVYKLCAEKDAASDDPQGVIHEFPLHPEKQIVYSSTSKSFLHDYDKGEIWAVTGTAGGVIEKEEAALLYGKKGEEASPMLFVTVPRNKELKREDKPLRLTANFNEKIMALKAYIDEAKATGRPVLLISENDKESERIRRVLQAYYPASARAEDQWQFVDSGTTAEAEATIVANAGRPGCVTFATGRLGRGTDIKLPTASKDAGGLSVLVSFLPRERDMWQIFGRSGRYGDEGDARIVCSAPELARKLGKKELDSDFYLSTEYYIKTEQARFDREKQMERLVRNSLSDFRAKITDAFFRYYDSLTELSDKERREKVLQWSDFTKRVDQLWNQAWPDILTQLTKAKADMHEIMKRLHRFKQEVQKDWRDLHGSLKADEAVLPSKLSDLQLDFRTEYLMRIMMPKRKYTVADQTQVYKVYDKSHDGRAVVYCQLFAELRAIWRGERVLFANTRAWWAGRGILFANTRALLSGRRPLFANFRAWLYGVQGPLQQAQDEPDLDLMEVLEGHDQEGLKQLTPKLNAIAFLGSKKNDLSLALRIELVEAVLDFANQKLSKQEEVTAPEMDQMYEILKVAKEQEGNNKQIIAIVADKLQHKAIRFFGPSLKSNVASLLQERFDEYRKDKKYHKEQELNEKQKEAFDIPEAPGPLDLPKLLPLRGGASVA